MDAAAGVGIVRRSHPQVDQRSDAGNAAGLLGRTRRPQNKKLYDGAVVRSVRKVRIALRSNYAGATAAAGQVTTRQRRRQRRQRGDIHFPQHLQAVHRADVVERGGRPHRAYHDISVDHQRGGAVSNAGQSTRQRISRRRTLRATDQRLELRTLPQVQRHPGRDAIQHTPTNLAKPLEVYARHTLPNGMLRFDQRIRRHQRHVVEDEGACSLATPPTAATVAAPMHNIQVIPPRTVVEPRASSASLLVRSPPRLIHPLHPRCTFRQRDNACTLAAQ